MTLPNKVIPYKAQSHLCEKVKPCWGVCVIHAKAQDLEGFEHIDLLGAE